MTNLPERFYDAARRVLLKESDRLDFDAADILRIAQDTAMQAEFREILRNEVNNSQLADIVVHYLNEIASRLGGFSFRDGRCGGNVGARRIRRRAFPRFRRRCDRVGCRRWRQNGVAARRP